MSVFSTFNTATDGDMNTVIQFGSMTSDQSVDLDQVIFTLSTASTLTNPFTITKKSHRPSFFDSNLLTQDMTTVKDVVWRPGDGPIRMNGRDRLAFAWTADKAWCIEVFYTPR